MVNALNKYSLKPEGPLQILQGGLELGIQLIVHTLHAYKSNYLRLPQGHIVPMSDLGYEVYLCNMALVNAAASWDGFKGNIVRAVRTSGHSFSETQLCKRLKQTSYCEQIKEPLARRHCIVHNLAKVDRDYKADMPSSTLDIGDSLASNLTYLKNASVSFFDNAVNLIKLLIEDGLLTEDYQKAIGKFQRDPTLGPTTPIRRID